MNKASRINNAVKETTRLAKMANTEKYMEIKLTVPWGHVAARTYGPSTGKPILVAHGYLDNAGSFTRLMKYLPKESFYYVCIDFPGHGWSSHFPSWMLVDFSNYVHTLYFILEALQWKTFIYLGHSMGAVIGLLFSILHPNRIEKLISIDGLVLNTGTKDFVNYYKKGSELSLKAFYNNNSDSFTKEEIIYAFKNLRMASLNSEAAEAIFERAVTKVNDKYIYNRDIRLKHFPFAFNKDEIQNLNKNISIPCIYIFILSQGCLLKEEYKSTLKTMKKKNEIKVIFIEGNHDLHNNDPEKIAPFIYDILKSNTINNSKL